ncbi:MAG: mechanosensitive ion channel [Rikenellaceae bacterium]|nr:mechanosensitive ion channel [Rikenellaceae bacterium]
MDTEEAISFISKGILSFFADVLICIVIYYVGRAIVRYIDRLLGRVFSKRGVEVSIAKFARSMIRAIIYIGIAFAILNQLGIETTSFLAIFASVGVGVGMAMSGTLQNFAGGVMVLLTRPFKIGDYVQMQGVEGTIKEIRLFNTTINTVDNKMIIVPNGNIVSNIINNFSAEDIRRVDWTFSIRYGDDYDTAKQAIEEVLKADSRVMTEPAPFVALSALADSSINIVVRVWTKASDYWGVYFDMNEKIYKTLPTKGLHFPYPHVDVTLTKEN